jgi:exodeoxyribonuclease VII large subunit
MNVAGHSSQPDVDVKDAISVTRLNTIAKEVLQSSEELADVWVCGEISNLTKHVSGHYYFSLKDETSGIGCAFFKGARQRVSLEIEENMKVAVFGSVDLYLPKGEYKFIVRNVKAYGIGELHKAYEALRKKLEAEGLFAARRKRPLPPFPKRVGVVTSQTGAAIRDILTVTARRFPADVLVAPALVQGEGAAASIVNGIRLLNDAGVDVIIVGRGGGSLEDLWAFNEEAVARAIYASRVPVVSAVGHETDYTIADYVADVRAPTPSTAAELVLPDRQEQGGYLSGLLLRARVGLTAPVEKMRRRLERTDSVLSESAICRLLDDHGERLADAETDLLDAFRRRIQAESNRLATAEAALRGLDPRGVLERGYCIARSKSGGVVNSISSVRTGEEIEVIVRDGALKAVVKRKVHGNE